MELNEKDMANIILMALGYCRSKNCVSVEVTKSHGILSSNSYCYFFSFYMVGDRRLDRSSTFHDKEREEMVRGYYRQPSCSLIKQTNAYMSLLL